MATTVDVKLLPVQYDFVTDDSAWSLVYGGRGSSKTTALAWGVFMRASVPHAREGLFRQKLIDLKGTTLKTLLEGDGSQPPIIPPGSYTHNKAEKTIKIHGGGEIIYNGFDTGEVSRKMGSTGKASSLNLTGAHFDEAVEMSEANVTQVAMSVRVKINRPDTGEQMPLVRRFACNPGPPSHWIAKRWGLAPDTPPLGGHVARHADPRDNHHLPKEFLDELGRLEGVARQRYLLGMWVGSDGLVYNRFDRRTHMVTRPPAPATSKIIGVDYGYTDPFCALEIHRTEGGYHVAREVYETKLVPSEMIARIKSMADADTEVIVDSAQPDFIEALRRENVRARPADKGPGSIVYGINIVQEHLSEGRLTIDHNCTNTVREFESYEWKESIDGLQDQPRDADNHAMDALRYALRYVHEDRGGMVRMAGANGTASSTPSESVHSYAARKRAEDPDWGF